MDNWCYRCGKNPRASGSSYCLECNREISKEKYDATKAARTRDFEKLVKYCQENNIKELARKCK